MEFFNKTGKMALGSRLRLLTAKMTDDALAIYQLYGMDFSPKWFPVLYILHIDGPKTITEIALAIGHSQPSVTKISKELIAAGLIDDNIASEDKRRNIIGLTTAGSEIAEKIINVQGEDVAIAVDSLIAEATHNLWDAVEEWEFLLNQKSLLTRVKEQKKIREGKAIQIVPYDASYQQAFKALNEEWISTYFELEETDRKALDHPDSYILQKGGKIVVALADGAPVGVCALIKMEDGPYDFEMAKMAVSPKAQGKGIAWLLGQEIVRIAKDMGASKLYLESNTILAPAINLYYKMGFQKIAGYPSPYKRCNIQMELLLQA